MRSTIMIMLVLAAACTPAGPGPVTFDPQEDVEASQFSTAEQLRTFIEQHQGDDGYYAMDARLLGGVAMDMAVAESAAPSQGYSDTNVQVAGIDEADILKTDGEYIYTVTGETLFVVEAGEDAEVIATVDFTSAPQGLFLDDDRLAVFGSFYDNDYFREHDILPRSGMTYLDVYDVSDPEEPELVEEYKFEGNYMDGRMTDGWVYLVVRSTPEIRPLPMPLVIEGEAVTRVAVHDVSFYPIPYDRMEFATVHALDLDGERHSKTVAVDGAQHLYMSPERIYLTSTEYINEWEIRQDIQMEILEPSLTTSDRELIEKIEDVDPSVLTTNEKRNKIYQVYSRYMSYMDSDEREEFEDEVEVILKERLSEYEALEYTLIHQLSVDDGDIDIGASGKVPGTIVNQFSMDEHEDVFRVATTLRPRNFWWADPMPMVEEVVESDERIAPTPRPTQSVNNVYTLDMDMEILGSLEGLAEGESIFSTRFMGDRLYMVTFRQVDPFFVIDLSDPEDIRELGELKIPGFSRYLHPYDDDHIIGIGRDASQTGRQRGIKISLFDVSDFENPEEVTNWVAGERYSQTSAEWEHHAFLFSRERNLLVIPAWNYGYQGSESYNGAMVFRIDTDEIELRGIIDHSDGEQRYGPTVERSLYIGELLYTKSPDLLRVNELDTLEGVQDVELESGKTGPYPVY